MKIQPLDADSFRVSAIRADSAKPVLKSRLKRLFDRPFHNVLRISSAEKIAEPNGAGAEFEPSSIGLDKMVQSFMEDNNEKQLSAKLSRNRCNCFNGNNNDSSDDESDDLENGSPTDSTDMLKGLVQCASKNERNLLADTSKIVEKNKACKGKDDLRQIVTVGLEVLGYDASICKSRWEKSPTCPAGEYEYIDVIVEGERLIIDVDFRSEFEIARSTSSYKSILLSLPHIFVGGPDRLHQIVLIVSEAAKQSLKKKGMHIPPWRKADYMRAKWLSPHTRAISQGVAVTTSSEEVQALEAKTKESSECGDLALLFGEEAVSLVDELAASAGSGSSWQPPEIKLKSCEKGSKVVVTGLACLLREKP